MSITTKEEGRKRINYIYIYIMKKNEENYKLRDKTINLRLLMPLGIDIIKVSL